MVSEFVLVRHGESMGNLAAAAASSAGVEQIMVEHRDPDVPLSPLGLEQAVALGRGLAPLVSDQVSTAVWSSPYRRALDTARTALSQSSSELPVFVDERLRDRELGVLDLLTRRGVANRFPLEAERRQWWGKFYHRPPGGESWADVALRLRSYLNEVLISSPADRIVLVVHDAVVMLVRYILEALDEQTLLQIGATTPVKNASISIVQRREERWEPLVFNDVRHLVEQGAAVTEHGGEPDVSH